MEESKKSLAEKMYRILDESCGDSFDLQEDKEEFIQAFKRALYDYSLVPTVRIIEE